jgi:hypothetical protein
MKVYEYDEDGGVRVFKDGVEVESRQQEIEEEEEI